MRRILFVTATAVLTSAAVAAAEDPRPVQPKVLPAQPVQPRPIVVSPSRVAQLEEEVETLEAQRDVKRAHIKAAEVGVRAAELDIERLKKAVASGIVPKEEFDRAALAVESAKLQVEIRAGELKEVEVRLKHAKKRLDDAKAVGTRPAPAPGGRPVPVDPQPRTRVAADEKAVAELKAKLEKLTAEVAQVAAESKKADAELKAAEAELVAIKKAAALGRIKAGTIETAEAKVQQASEVGEKLAKQSRALAATIADLQKKLKDVEK